MVQEVYIYTVETLGLFGIKACHFFKEVARRMEIATVDHFTHHHLVQCISVAIQRGNAAAVLGSMGVMREG